MSGQASERVFVHLAGHSLSKTMEQVRKDMTWGYCRIVEVRGQKLSLRPERRDFLGG